MHSHLDVAVRIQWGRHPRFEAAFAVIGGLDGKFTKFAFRDLTVSTVSGMIGRIRCDFALIIAKMLGYSGL